MESSHPCEQCPALAYRGRIACSARPWSCPDGQWVFDGDGKPILHVQRGIPPAGPAAKKKHQANVRLMLTSPDLLFALDIAETALALSDRECYDAPPGKGRCVECAGCLREQAFWLAGDAIEQATGRNPRGAALIGKNADGVQS